MSKSIMSRTVVVLAFVAAIAAPAAAVAGDVRIAIDGIRSGGGQLLVALQTRDQFLKQEGTYGERIVDIAPGARTVTLSDVAPGRYSISVLHDTDGDGQMKMAGTMPAEGWAMLNGDTLRAVPTFEAVSFEVPADGSAIDLTMDYPRAR